MSVNYLIHFSEIRMVHKYINSPHRLQTKIVIFLQERPLPIALYPVQKEHQAVTKHGIKQVTSVYECANQARILINEIFLPVSHSSPFSHIRALEGQLLSSA